MQPAPVLAPPEPREAPRVLVVDDDEAIRRIIVRTLRLGGVDVVAARNADEALRRLAGAEFDLVLTDISMPERSGLWLAERVREQRPSQRIVLMSGAQLSAEEIAWIGRLDATFLSKPFEPRTMAETVRRELTAAPPGSADRTGAAT